MLEADCHHTSVDVRFKCRHRGDPVQTDADNFRALVRIISDKRLQLMHTQRSADQGDADAEIRGWLVLPKPVSIRALAGPKSPAKSLDETIGLCLSAACRVRIATAVDRGHNRCTKTKKSI